MGAYMIMMVPAILLSALASLMVHMTFSRYSKFGSRSGMTGAEAARRLLSLHGLGYVKIEQTNGFLGDHYDPSSKTLRLSESVYASQSLAAIGVACHEAGHAMQHADHYSPLSMRTAMVPAVQFGSSIAWIMLAAGMALQLFPLIQLGVILFSVAVLFSIITLPVEWNASARAKELVVQTGIISEDERFAVNRVLNAAFLTYLAGAFAAVMQLLYYLMLSRRN
jgi:Zn-dependent membrane protease YugP